MAEETRSAAPQADVAHVRRIEAVVNLASGSVSASAPDELKAALRDHGGEANVRACAPGELAQALQEAVDAKPDLLIVLAGDGTIRAAAQACGFDGPALAPLAGGTMNVLPYALYGRRPWREALEATLEDAEIRTVSGGEIAGRAFYVAAILGSPALWATAREALRAGKLSLAWMRARRALKRAFSGRLRLSLDGAPRRKVEALALICPLVARGFDRDDALEACLLDIHGAADAFRLGARAMLGDAVGGWRGDAAVDALPMLTGRAWAHGRIPVILDGEPHRLDPETSFAFKAQAFRAWVPREIPEAAKVGVPKL